jgi:hypothetical protein
LRSKVPRNLVTQIPTCSVPMESFGAQPVLHPPPPPLDKYTHPKEQNERKKTKKNKNNGPCLSNSSV